MSDILGPASTANAVTVRPTDPRNFGAVDTWQKDCTSPLTQDGTPITAALLNGFLAQFRSIWRGNGKLADGTTPVVAEVADDAGVWKAIQRLFQRAQPTYAVDTGAANHLVVSLAPALQEYKAGMTIRVKVNSNNTGATDIVVNGLSARAIKNPDGTDLAADDLYAGGVAVLTDDGDHFELMAKHTDRAGSEGTGTRYRVPYVLATGTAAAITATYAPVTPSPVAGDLFSIKLASDIPGATTFAPDAHGPYPVVDMSGGALASKFALAGDRLLFEFDGVNMVVLNKFSLGTVGTMTPGGIGSIAMAFITSSGAWPGPSAGYLNGSSMWTNKGFAGDGNQWANQYGVGNPPYTGTWQVLSKRPAFLTYGAVAVGAPPPIDGVTDYDEVIAQRVA
jgi:hypothetical protein